MESTEEIVNPTTDDLSDSERKKQELAAKREARRRKILENSSNRLEKISGRPVDPEPESSDIIYPDPEVDREIFETFRTTTTFFNTDSGSSNRPFTSPEELIFNTLLNNAPAFSGASQQPQEPPKPLKFYEKILLTKVQIALIAIVSYISIITGIGSLIFSSSIFMLFLIWEMAETYLLRTKRNTPSSGNFQFLLLLGGINQERIKPYLKMFETVNRVLSDPWHQLPHEMKDICKTSPTVVTIKVPIIFEQLFDIYWKLNSNQSEYQNIIWQQ